jgi:SAM-dependent methyltransferase
MVVSKIKNIFFKNFPSWDKKLLKKELLGCSSVLDVGCGPNSRIQIADVPFSVGVDLFEPYIQKSKEKKIHNKYIKADIREVEFKPDSFDAVICIDVLEHLTKEEGTELIKKMENWAKKKIIVFTPKGYRPQEQYDDNLLQEHKSGWSRYELEEFGFKVYGVGWKVLLGPKGEFKYKPEKLWNIFSDLTLLLPYHFPILSFHMLAVKMIK